LGCPPVFHRILEDIADTDLAGHERTRLDVATAAALCA
jgi:hypothetical protein